MNCTKQRIFEYSFEMIYEGGNAESGAEEKKKERMSSFLFFLVSLQKHRWKKLKYFLYYLDAFYFLHFFHVFFLVSFCWHSCMSFAFENSRKTLLKIFALQKCSSINNFFFLAYVYAFKDFSVLLKLELYYYRSFANASLSTLLN